MRPMPFVPKSPLSYFTSNPCRVAEFDWRLLRMGSTLNAPTDTALTFVDYLSKSNTQARRFEQLTPETIRLSRKSRKWRPAR